MKFPTKLTGWWTTSETSPVGPENPPILTSSVEHFGTSSIPSGSSWTAKSWTFEVGDPIPVVQQIPVNPYQQQIFESQIGELLREIDILKKENEILKSRVYPDTKLTSDIPDVEFHYGIKNGRMMAIITNASGKTTEYSGVVNASSDTGTYVECYNAETDSRFSITLSLIHRKL